MRVRRGAVVVAAVFAVVPVAAGCSSSGSPATSPAPPSSPLPSISVLSSSPAPSPMSSAAPAPLSAFESDPAVQALRQWLATGARVVNTGHYTSPALDMLETAYVARGNKTVWGPDVGSYYPGPLPYRPLGVVVASGTTRVVHGCAELNGFAQDRATHRPAHALQIAGVDAQMMNVAGTWRVSNWYLDKSVSCKGVTVRVQWW